ncbi:carboxylate--amine ligase [Salana multivorans]|uniref:carboxylate--amine ligase n=1 Tax=Salana multivorans TaxID=120377 RepID=UPI0011CD9A90|nr:carboxylate--amine ligase [Salana multivorans]
MAPTSRHRSSRPEPVDPAVAGTVPRPVILGGDLGAYGSARAFHEAFGVRSVVVAGARTGAVADSAIVDLRVVPGLETPQLLAEVLRSVAAEEPGRPHLVLASADWLVDLLVRAAPSLADVPDLVVPYPDAATVARVSSKAEVMAACAELGVPHPETLVVVPGEPGIDDRLRALTYPRVVKVASTTAAHAVSYPGQAKVHVAASADEAVRLLATMAGAGLGSPVLVQELLPGGDAAMAAANVFLDARGRPVLAQLGRVLLEEHTPSALGNSVAQATVDARQDPAVQLTLREVVRLVEHLGWSGFANVDLMRDADGVYRVLEINPRVGRSGFAVTASGYNVAALYAHAFVPADREAAEAGGDAAPSLVLASREHLFTVVPLLLLRVFAPEQRRLVRRLRRAGAVTNPLYYRAERSPRRWLYIAVAMANQLKKFARHHPASPLVRRRPAR